MRTKSNVFYYSKRNFINSFNLRLATYKLFCHSEAEYLIIMDGHSDFTTISSTETYKNCIRNFHEFDANQFEKLLTSPLDSTPLRYNVFFFLFLTMKLYILSFVLLSMYIILYTKIWLVDKYKKYGIVPTVTIKEKGTVLR